MAYEFNDLKGFLFLVLLTIPLTTTTNINCNEKPFYCVNATHFMICVDLGNGVSSTIDDFVIPCPPTTVCHPNNRFECEFPHIEVTPPPLNVIGVSATDEKNVVSPLIDSVTTTAQIQETTSPPIELNQPTLEEVISPKLIELSENLKEEYTNGNDPFFDVTTILPSNAVSSNEISTNNFDKHNNVTDSDIIYDARSTTETTTLMDNNTEVLLTDNSLPAETTTPVAELFDFMSKNNLEMNKTTHQLGTPENLQVGDILHVTTTTFTPLIDTEQNFDLNVTSDNMIPVNHTNYQRSFQNNIASPNLKLSNASVVTINIISTTEGVPATTTNYVEPTTRPDNAQTTTIQDNLRLEGKYMLTTDAPRKSDDYMKILSNQAFSEEKTSIHQDTIDAESITYEPLKVSNKTIEVDSNNSFFLLAPLEKQETPYNFVRDDSLPERVTEPSFLAKTDVTNFVMTTEYTDEATNVEPTTTPDNPQTTTIPDNLRSEEKYMLNTDAPGKSNDHIKILSNQTFGEEKASVRQDTIGAELITYEPLEVSNKAVEVESNNSFILSASLTKEETPFNSVRDDSLPEKVTELYFLAKPDVTDIIITTEDANKATNTATEALLTTDSIITVKIDIDTKNSEDFEKKSFEGRKGTFLDDARLYQDASKLNVTSNMKLDNAKERIVNGTIGFEETTNNMMYTTVSAIEPSTGVTDEHESETINMLNWQDKETTTFRNTVLNNDQYAGIASTIPTSYSTGDVYKTTPNPLDEKLSSTSSYGTIKDSSSNVIKLETVDNVLNISISLINEASGTVPSLEPINYTADILYEADAMSIIQTTIVDINNYESNSSTEPVDGHTPRDEVKISSMHPTAIAEKIDTTDKNSEDVTFIPQYTNTIDENNKKYYEETTNKVQNNFIISHAETPTSPTYAIEQGNIDLVRPENVPNLIIPTTESSSTDLIKQGDSKATEIHTSISNNFVTTERSNTDINKTRNILFTSTLPINETHTRDIKDVTLTSATAASQTESNQVSEHDTEYERTMGAIEVDYTPSLTTLEPSNVKVTNVEDTKLSYNYSSSMALISPQPDNVLTTQAKVNTTIITDQNHSNTNESKYSTLTQIKNNTSKKKIKQNETHSLGTGEYTPEPSKNIEYILATTLTPITITSRSPLNKDERVVKLKEALPDLSTETPLLNGTEFINDINSRKTTTNEVLTTTEAYDFYPKYDVTTKYSNMNEEENTATLRNDINLKVSSNIKTDNLISDSIITAATNMGNPSSGYEIKTWQSKPVLLKDINVTMLTATAASSFANTTESNQVSEHDTEYNRTMGSIEVDYSPSLITIEPSNVKVTNVEDTKIKFNCSSNMLSILLQEDKVLKTQAKGNNTMLTDQNDGTNNIKYATLTHIQNNTSEKNIEQNATHSLRTGEYIPRLNKNNENILATTLTPIIITSRSKLHKDENVVKLKEALSGPSTENPLFTGTEFINYIKSLKTKTDEVLTTTEAYDLYPKYDVTTKYSNINEEDNTATLRNDINLKVSSNIKIDNPMSDTIITTETNMGREPNPSSGYDTMLTSATTARSFAYTTESNQVSEHDTEYKRIMGPVDVDYTPSLTIVEPNNIKVTNLENTKYSKINEEGNPASLSNDMNLKVFSNIKTDDQMSDTIITTKTYIDNREPNPSSGCNTKTQTDQSDETPTTPKVIVAIIEKSIPSRITPAVVVLTDKDSISNINISFNKQTSSIMDPNVNTNDPTNTITHSITKPTVIVETVADPNLDDVILTEFMLANDTVNLNKNQLHLQNMSYSNTTAHKEALHKSRFNMTFNSEKSANLSNREVMDLENGNNTLRATEVNIEIDGNKNQNDLSIEDKYESSTAYFEIPSRIKITTPIPLIHQNFKIFVNDVEHKPIMNAAGSAGFHLMQKENESISSSSMIESKEKTTSGNESKYNYSSINNLTYKVLITDKEHSNNSQASGNNKANIGVSNLLGNITEQQSIINDKVVTSYVQTHIINNKITNLVNNESNATIMKTKDSSASTNLNRKPNINNTTSAFNCWNNTRGKYANSKDCRKFYICLGKLDPIIGLCPNNTVFSEINKQCTRNLSHCVRNNQFHCVYEGRFSDFIKDNTYYICVKYNMHFLRYKLQCEIGYHLNKATVKCEKNVENASQSGSSVSENSQAKEKSENLDNKEDFECKQEGKFSYSKDCRKYYVCSKNKKNEYRRKIKKCTDDTVYDIEKEKCISAESNEC